MNNTAQVVGGVAALAALALAASNVLALVKYVLAKDVNALVTNLLFFGASLGLLVLAANANYVQNAVIPGVDIQLRLLDFSSLVIVALGIYGVGGFFYDRTKARDNTQSAAQPPLFGANNDPNGPVVG